MRRSNNEEELDELNAEDWMMSLLDLNPDYVYWGNFEDYMSNKGSGWNSALEYDNWSEMFGLDELNECVNFYFEVHRESKACLKCDESGYNEATKQISNDWYSFDRSKWIRVRDGRQYNDFAWCNHINDNEVEALVKAGRLSDFFENRLSVSLYSLAIDYINLIFYKCFIHMKY